MRFAKNAHNSIVGYLRLRAATRGARDVAHSVGSARGGTAMSEDDFVAKYVAGWEDPKREREEAFRAIYGEVVEDLSCKRPHGS
jgi:hypothetical protein